MYIFLSRARPTNNHLNPLPCAPAFFPQQPHHRRFAPSQPSSDPPPPRPTPPFPGRSRAKSRVLAIACPTAARMPPRRRRYLGARLQDSGRYAAELTVDRVRWWLDTSDAPEVAARAYDYDAWSLGLPRSTMNFPEVRSFAEPERLSSPVRMVTREQEKENRQAFLQIRTRDINEAAMEKMCQDHPKLVQYEVAYFAAREAANKKKDEAEVVATESTSTGPCTIDNSSGSSDEFFSDFWNDLTSDEDADKF